MFGHSLYDGAGETTEEKQNPNSSVCDYCVSFRRKVLYMRLHRQGKQKEPKHSNYKTFSREQLIEKLHEFAKQLHGIKKTVQRRTEKIEVSRHIKFWFVITSQLFYL